MSGTKRVGVKQKPVITRYKIKSNTSAHLRIALIADLHEQEGSTVIDILKTLSPDMILMPGDMIETNEAGLGQHIKDEYQIYLKKSGRKATDPKFQSMFITGTRFPGLYFSARILIHLLGILTRTVRPNREKHGEDFLKRVRNIAPCYFSRGNHDSLLEEVPDGITLLENEYVIIHAASGENIAIGGVSRNVDFDWLDEFEQVPAFHILLCHYPDLYEPLFKKRRIELIVSGHAHGGQVRIGGKGLYAPDQGLFPKYTKGVYDNRLVVTTGLCNNGVIPRLGNPTEVVFIEICPNGRG